MYVPLYALFRLHFVPERNKHHSRADFFNLKREPGEPAAETWKRILEIEKNCEFEEITAAELLASKFLSVIGKTTGDNNLKKKIKKGDMSVEAITDTIHEYTYEKMNESRDSEEETNIQHVDRKRNYQKPEKDKPNKFRKVDCIRCGAPNWNKLHDCPAKDRPKNKTHTTGIGNIRCRRRRMVTKQNTSHNQNGPFNKTEHQRRTTILHCNGIGQ